MQFFVRAARFTRNHLLPPYLHCVLQGVDQDIERVIHSEKEKWRQILRIIMDAVLYLSTNCLSFRRSHETPSDLITQYPQPSQEVAGKTGENICQQILEKLAVDDLNIGQCRGQSYDNGSNMASIHKGVQARIAERNELAEFVPCLAHS
ncbi:hypothetical protein EVAR_16993_1 [Eumeta japonica]|uniref:DUF4371 domain-containing protein n=1 Tax=Eumeta variegata TaxID=151549 RepID=A0A4C1TVL2_EUMVA|nr:hypothetical protein EVAR_16993_1 [Eumeta japonica]